MVVDIPRHGIERATPHQLVLCILIRVYASSDDSEFGPEFACDLTINQVRQLQLFLTKAVTRVDTIVEPVLTEICKDLSENIDDGEQVSSYLSNLLHQIASPDDLFDLLQIIENVFATPEISSQINPQSDRSGRPCRIEKSSVFGTFLRRILLSCRSTFESLSRLFHELKLYTSAKSSGLTSFVATPRRKTSGIKRKASSTKNEPLLPEDPYEVLTCTPNSGNTSDYDDNSNKASGESLSRPVFRSFVSRRQLQHHFHTMAEELESRLGVVSYEQIEKEVSAMLAVSPDLPRAHFVRYLNCLMHREYQGAVDSLHTYFDYCTRVGGPTNSAPTAQSGNTASSTHGAAAIHASATLGRRRPMMQYAVLNLAALHFEFGHRKESMLAIQETVRVAQQNGDHVCVVFALSWLFRLASSNGGQETSQLLRRCLTRAKELGLYQVQGLSQLVMAQYAVFGSTSIPTAMPPVAQGFYACREPRRTIAQTVWESLQHGVDVSTNSIGAYHEAIASSLQIGSRQNRPANDQLTASGMPDRSSRIAIAEAIRIANACTASPGVHLSTLTTIAGRSLLIQSVSWEQFGHLSLSWLASLSHMNYFGGLPGTSASDTCLAICKLATIHAATGELPEICPSTEGQERQSRVFDGGLALLKNAREKYRHRAHNMITLTIAELLFKRAMMHDNFLEIILLGSSMRSLKPIRQSVSGIGGNSTDGDDLALNVEILWTSALATKGRLVEAYMLAHSVMTRCPEIRLLATQQAVDLSLSDMFLRSASPIGCLPYILRCLSQSRKSDRDTMHAAASLKLASVQLKLGYVFRALGLLEKCLPHVVVHGTLLLKGEMFLLFGKCTLIKSKHMPVNILSSLSDAQGYFEKAYTYYASAESREFMMETLYLLARVHDALAIECEEDESVCLSHQNSRDAFAQQFMDMRSITHVN